MTSKPWQRHFLELQRLPDGYLTTAGRYFDPLAAVLAQRARARGATFCVALNGSQGSGKSTLGEYLSASLGNEHGLTAVTLSLDDFYLTHAERQRLAARIHPLLATRGVPGTHDVALLLQTIRALSAKSTAPVAVPRFDKSTDDRAPADQWTLASAPVDVVLLEGWCLGAHCENRGSLRLPINALERDEDSEVLWRSYCNQQLKDQYEVLYDDLDFWVMLAAPGFEQVLRWRSEQETKLRAAVGGRGDGLMDEAMLARFVQHFERYTRQCLRDLPQRVDVLLTMDAQRNITRARGLGPSLAPGSGPDL